MFKRIPESLPIFALAGAAALALMGCREKSQSPQVVQALGSSSSASTSNASPDFSASVILQDQAGISQASYKQGTSVDIKLRMVSTATQDRTINFTSPTRFAVKISDSIGQVHYDSRLRQAAGPALGTELIRPGQAIEETLRYDGKALSGMPLPPGGYILQADILGQVVGIGILPALSPLSLRIDPTVGTPQNGQVSATFKARDRAGLEQVTFLVGDPITLEIALTNFGQQALNLNFASAQEYEFVVKTSTSGELWRWSLGKAFTPAFQQKSVLPGQTITYRETWDGRDSQGVQVQGGAYTIEGSVLASSLLGSIQLPPLQPLLVTLSGQVITGNFDFSSRLIASNVQGAPTSTFAAGSQIQLDIELANNTNDLKTLMFTSSLTHDIVVHDSTAREIWRYSTGKVNTSAFIVRAVMPRARLLLGAIWDGRDSSGKTVPAGTYRISGEVKTGFVATATVAPPQPMNIQLTGSAAQSGLFDVQFSVTDSAGQIKNSFTRGEVVRLKLEVTNRSLTTQTLNFPTGQNFDFVVRDTLVGERWRWSQGRFFTQAITTLTFMPGQAMSFETTWDLRDSSGNLIQPGIYSVAETLLSASPLIGGSPSATVFVK